ncbi:MAG: hypothetical protein NTZ42_03045 [Candidatus Gribaldobacteria bacterium]|nr:hypothetical protein [Candidatus Gribaldobacteria bacterium]
MEIDDVIRKLEDQQIKIDAIYKSVEKTRKYFLVTLIVSAACIIFPLIALVFMLPNFLKVMTGSGLGL